MSLARFGCDGSDVYVFRTVGSQLECCGCQLGPDFITTSPEEMAVHLREHQRAGHTVPADVFDALADGSWRNQ